MTYPIDTPDTGPDTASPLKQKGPGLASRTAKADEGRESGFFTSVAWLRLFNGGAVWWSLRARRLLCPVRQLRTVPAAPLAWGGGFAYSAKDTTMHPITTRRLHTPSVPCLPLALALYRALRPLAGPVLAYRVAFGWRVGQ